MESTNSKLRIEGCRRGSVVDNLDPLKTGRVKVMVHSVMQGVDEDSLPWAKPMWSSIVGGSDVDAGYFAVPDLGSEVFVIFEDGDPFSPIYIGSASDVTHGQPSFKNEDYPDTKGIKFKNGFEVYLNQKEDIFKINHPSGTFFEIDKLGKISFYSPDEVELLASKPVTITSAISAKVAAPVVTLEAVNVNINGQYVNSTVSGDANVTVEGSVNLDATGSVDISSVESVSISGSSIDLN